MYLIEYVIKVLSADLTKIDYLYILQKYSNSCYFIIMLSPLDSKYDGNNIARKNYIIL